MIIGLVGPKLSGKGTIGKHLQEKYNAEMFTMSSIIGDIAKRLYLPNTRANLIAIVSGLRSTLGEDILAQVLKQDIERSQSKLIVIDGIRMPREVDLFSALPNFNLIFVDAPIEQRYERATKRGEKIEETTMTFEQFQAEEQAATETHIQSLRQQAKQVIHNDKSVDELHRAVDKLVQEA